jgi:hypothetical protein
MEKVSSIFVLLVLTIPKLYSQGCSDAGICSISSSHHINSTELKKNSLEVGYIFGKGLENVIYNNGFIGYTRDFKNNWGLSSRITYNQATGSFGKLGRLGDIFFVINYKKEFNKNSFIKPSFGLKIPLSTSNFKINQIALPLDYQASLGTFDALLGIEYFYKKWKVDAAFQLPFWQINRNSYFDEYSASNDFPSTNLFKRKPDILLRTAYTFHTKNKKWFFKPNVLAIYHLGNDTYEDIFGKRKEIEDSQGITINASLITDYNINNKNRLSLNIAAPLLVREIRPDGLTRAFVASISYQYKF